MNSTTYPYGIGAILDSGLWSYRRTMAPFAPKAPVAAYCECGTTRRATLVTFAYEGKKGMGSTTYGETPSALSYKGDEWQKHSPNGNPLGTTSYKKKYKFIPMEYKLDSFQRSNQDTCITHKPAVFEGDWIQSGDILTDCASSVGGELALGQNLLIAYLPWEGYNFEDAILISERLVIDDLYTSVHIERYEMEIHQTNLGVEEITRDIPDVSEAEVENLDSFGVVKIGSWVEEGDILVGKITPIPKNTISPYQKLLYTILEKKVRPFRDSSLRAPKGVKAKVIDIKYFSKSKGIDTVLNELTLDELPVPSKKSNTKKSALASQAKKKRKTKRLTPQSLLNKWSKLPNNKSLLSPLNHYFSTYKKMNLVLVSDTQNTETFSSSLWGKNSIKKVQNPFLKTQKTKKIKNVFYSPALDENTPAKLHKFSGNSQRTNQTRMLGNASSQHQLHTIKNIETIHIYLAETRKIQVGDKMSGRHGNKGIVSQILPIQDMPYLPDGTPIDMVLNPLGVPSRMNVGQIYECLLGLAGRYLGENYKVSCFDEIYGPDASRSFVFNKLYEASKTTGLKWLFDPNTPGKVRIYDGRTGDSFDQAVTAGHAYILRLVHMVDDKIHMRSTGPYSLVTQQPLRGRSKEGGQRLGEMEVWALEGYGAAFTLLEMLTIKSDDMTGRMTLWSNLILNKDISIGTPESFKVLVCELQALCLDIGLFRNTSTAERRKTTQLTEIDSLINLP